MTVRTISSELDLEVEEPRAVQVPKLDQHISAWCGRDEGPGQYGVGVQITHKMC